LPDDRAILTAILDELGGVGWSNLRQVDTANLHFDGCHV
jgi:hypothetical protein